MDLHEIGKLVVAVYSPASAGCTGLDPFRFFTGTVGTLKHKKTNLQINDTLKADTPQAGSSQQPGLKVSESDDRITHSWL